ncbi:MAG TPA: sigma-70 family RNA polymerase sigma factor [Acidimicrobiia bacterium]
MSTSRDAEHLLRDLAPQVLGALVRRYGHFDMCEDAVQEALLAASLQWPDGGTPERPKAWLITVASRRLTDALRSDESRRRREDSAAQADRDALVAVATDADDTDLQDDTLTLLFLCCHPVLTPSSQLALTLRAVGGLTTAEIARAFLVPETTMAQRISRAKERIRAAGATFTPPDDTERDGRLRVVLHVLYLVFNEGYAATSGPEAARADLTAEAIRLARAVHRLLPNDGEVQGLLALMLLTDARRPARVDADGGLVPLDEQDRVRWDRVMIDEGLALVTGALSSAPLGPYQVQAAIAALHAEARRAGDTDWAQIAALYALLEHLTPNPVVTLNRAVAVAMVEGPEAGLAMLEPLDGDERVSTSHRLDAVRAHLYDLAGDHDAATRHYLAAARSTTSIPERRFLRSRADRCAQR